MSTADHFSADYAAARRRFAAAAEAAGAVRRSHVLAGLRGPQNEELAVDVARLGAADADRALLVISGTHGVEGLCGSGCQVALLADRLHEALPPSACLLLVHALNPHGFAWLRRVTEDNVDLNRNFIDFAQPPDSSAYEALHELLVPAQWSGEGRRSADAALMAAIQKMGMPAFQQAASGGQYSRPTGMFYGGSGPTWSARTLAAILAEHLPAGLRRLGVLDLHTGLGPAGYGEPIATGVEAGDIGRARQWYGPEVKDLAAGESVSARLRGTLGDGVRRQLPGVELTFVGLEFGIRPIMEVLAALRADHALHAARVADVTALAAARVQMRAVFHSDSAAWQAAVYGRTADFVYRACRALAA